MALDLATIVLTGAYRQHRHSHLVLAERLPAELPVWGDERAREAWRRVVEARAACVNRGAVDPSFGVAAGRLVDALGAAWVPVYQLLRALHRGPYDVVDGRSVWGDRSPFRSDAEARRAYFALAPADRAHLTAEPWRETHWSYWRLVRRLNAADALEMTQRRLRGRRPGWRPKVA